MFKQAINVVYKYNLVDNENNFLNTMLKVISRYQQKLYHNYYLEFLK